MPSLYKYYSGEFTFIWFMVRFIVAPAISEERSDLLLYFDLKTHLFYVTYNTDWVSPKADENINNFDYSLGPACITLIAEGHS